jgi:hypothetical protein
MRKMWWFVAKAVATLVLIGLLVAGGVALYYAGLSQGYAASEPTVKGEDVASPPYPPGGFGHPGWHYRPLGVVGALLGIGLLILFFAVVAKLIRFIIWGPRWRFGTMGPWAGPWHRGHWRRAARWHRVHGPMPPWCWDWDEEAEKADEKPDAKE